MKGRTAGLARAIPTTSAFLISLKNPVQNYTVDFYCVDLPMSIHTVLFHADGRIKEYLLRHDCIDPQQSVWIPVAKSKKPLESNSDYSKPCISNGKSTKGVRDCACEFQALIGTCWHGLSAFKKIGGTGG